MGSGASLAHAAEDELLEFKEDENPAENPSAAISSPHHVSKAAQRALLIAQMPKFYVKNAEVNVVDIARVKSSWNMIIDDESTAFLEKKSDPRFAHRTCMAWFADTFYDRFFAVLPDVRPLFKSAVASQGQKLVSMMTLSVDLLNRDRNMLFKTLTRLARAHNVLGVMAHYYGIFTAVLLEALQIVLGPVQFTDDIRFSWRKAFSRMLDVFVSIGVKQGMYIITPPPEAVRTSLDPKDPGVAIAEAVASGLLSSQAKPTGSFSNSQILDAIRMRRRSSSSAAADSLFPCDMVQGTGTQFTGPVGAGGGGRGGRSPCSSSSSAAASSVVRRDDVSSIYKGDESPRPGQANITGATATPPATAAAAATPQLVSGSLYFEEFAEEGEEEGDGRGEGSASNSSSARLSELRLS